MEAATRAVEEISNLLEGGGLHEESLENIRRLAVEGAWLDCLGMVEALGTNMPYIDHTMLFELLAAAWEGVSSMKSLHCKKCYKKVRLLEEDKKADPLVLEKWTKERAKADQESSSAKIGLIRATKIFETLRERSGAGAGSITVEAATAPPQQLQSDPIPSPG